MPYGPVELLEVKFPGNQFRGEIIPALLELVDSGVVRIIDALFVWHDNDGAIVVTEFSDLDNDFLARLDTAVADVLGLISEEDVERLVETLEPESSAVLLLFENVWATRFVDALRGANAEVVLNVRIPGDVVETAAAVALLEAAE